SLEQIVCTPKVELHAHLFGSIRVSVLQQIKERSLDREEKASSQSLAKAEQDASRIKGRCIGIGDAFQYFSAVYELVRTRDDIVFALEEVLADFHRDNVVYLELRTTLKTIPEEGIDPAGYVALLVEKLHAAGRQYPMVVRLILSIDRASLTDAERARVEVTRVLDLAELYPDWIVGVDIAGDPRKGDILPALALLKKEVLAADGRLHGKLKITIHTAEIEGQEEETKAILALKPHRIGHGCYLTDSQRAETLQENAVVELCPTSNLRTLNLKGFEDHHFAYYYAQKAHCTGVCICTDDIGLFDTSLSEELYCAARAFNLSMSDIVCMQKAALRAAFCTTALLHLLGGPDVR
ncbi:adenosine amp deaminase domain-containing protein, partial [Cystoisospora suis]